MFTDKTLNCRDCGNPFIFTVGEQEFYQSRGLTNQPGRCAECRVARKGQGRPAGGGGHRGFEGGSRQRFQAVCAQCGQDAWLPFEPSSDKPVYCDDCFRRNPGYSGGGSGGGRNARY